MHSHRRRHLPLWVELPLLLLVAFCAAVLLRTFVLQPFDIPSGSMEQTLLVGDRVVVNKLVYQLRAPQRGEVVVFRGSDRWASEVEPLPEGNLLTRTGRILGDLVGVAPSNEKDLIKRIIGLPGDTVACCDNQGRVTVNGTPLDESAYLFENSPLDIDPNDSRCRARAFGPVHVPEGNVFVMGDHRGNSKDSRCQGFVPIDDFIGRAVAVVWPRSSWAWLDIPDSFSVVPPPDSTGNSGEKPSESGPVNGDTGESDLAIPLLAMAGLTRPGRRSTDIAVTDSGDNAIVRTLLE